MKNLLTAFFAVFFMSILFCCNDDIVNDVNDASVSNLSDVVTADSTEDITESVVVENIIDEDIFVIEDVDDHKDIQGE